MPSDTGQSCQYAFGDVHLALPGATKTFGGVPVVDVSTCVPPDEFMDVWKEIRCGDCEVAARDFMQRIMPIVAELYEALVGEEASDAEPC